MKKLLISLLLIAITTVSFMSCDNNQKPPVTPVDPVDEYKTAVAPKFKTFAYKDDKYFLLSFGGDKFVLRVYDKQAYENNDSAVPLYQLGGSFIDKDGNPITDFNARDLSCGTTLKKTSKRTATGGYVYVECPVYCTVLNSYFIRFDRKYVPITKDTDGIIQYYQKEFSGFFCQTTTEEEMDTNSLCEFDNVDTSEFTKIPDKYKKDANLIIEIPKWTSV